VHIRLHIQRSSGKNEILEARKNNDEFQTLLRAALHEESRPFCCLRLSKSVLLIG
jgi:hypothetical protein